MIVKRRVRARVRVAIAVAAALALLGGGWIWLRDSQLVGVRNVTISGLSGPDAGQIRSALTLAARNMTTLDVRIGQLRLAVAPYPVVKDLRVSTQFPHGMRIRVIEHLPVAAIEAGGRAIAAAGDGTLLHDAPTASLPTIPVPSLPGGSRVIGRSTLEALALLAATPARLIARIDQVTVSQPHGLVVALRSGPSIYFGDGSEFAAKWVAASEVMADRSSAGASYIDVSDPARPAAGVGEQAVVAAGLAATGSTAAANGASGTASTPQATTRTSTTGG